MNTKLNWIVVFSFIVIYSCKDKKAENDQVSTTEQTSQNQTTQEKPFIWDAANLYFLLTDRFHDGNPENNLVLDRTNKTAKLRGFEGGDLRGVIKKLKEGYFTDLGISAIWFSPVLEQIHGSTDEGTGETYGFHGYWTKDWTKIDPNFGTYEDLKELIDEAHKQDIRIVMDVVLNHTGPITDKDPVWPKEWVRIEPVCTYKDQETAVTCTLVKNLPDIKTESEEEVEIPKALYNKWQSENRLEDELAELGVFFAKTGLKKTPSNYIIKWLTDYIRELGIDAYRVDTVKHVEETIWKTLSEQAELAFQEWKNEHPGQVLDDNAFYMIGELYGYSIDHKLEYDFGKTQVNYYDHGFDNLINFQFKYDAKQFDYDSLFTKYDQILRNELSKKSITNYISSHDDGDPFDKERTKPIESATKLLLTPGISQIYYGDEIARPLIIDGTTGDATLRSKMDWDTFKEEENRKILEHWQKLGRFRNSHPAVGAGIHKTLSTNPYLCSRTYKKESFEDQIIIGLDLDQGKKELFVGNEIFTNGTTIRDRYSNKEVIVQNGKILIDTPFDIVLLEKI